MKYIIVVLATAITLCMWLMAGALLDMVDLQQQEIKLQREASQVVPNDSNSSIQIIPVPDSTPTPDNNYDNNNAADPNSNIRS